MTHGNTYNKSPRRINHKATKRKTNTGTTALERSVEQKKNKRKVQRVPQSQTSALPRPQEEEETDKSFFFQIMYFCIKSSIETQGEVS